MTYDDFEPGHILGQADLLLRPSLLASWNLLFPDDANGGIMSHGMVAVVSMRAFFAAVPARPPGNVHAAQYFDLHRLPHVGDLLTTRVSCGGKEVRRGRRWVTFDTETTVADAPAFQGRMTILWAR